MNEYLFFIHVFVLLSFGMLALRLGKASLTTWIALQAVLANLFVLKQMVFFGFHITCSDPFVVGTILGVNLLQEYFGKKAATIALWTCFASMIFFVIMVQVHLLYQPSSMDVTQAAYQLILSPSARLLGASLFAFFVVQQINVRMFSWLKNKWSHLSLGARNGISLVLSQLLDTLLFSYLGLWGLVSSVVDIIVISSLIKLLIIVCSTPFIALSKRMIPPPQEIS